MDDRVGDVLAQRASLDAGRAPAILISLVMHGGISALAIWGAMRATIPVPVQVLNIRFAGSVTPMTPATQVKAPVPPPAVKPQRIEAPQPKAEDVKPTAAKPDPKAVPFSPFGKSEKKGSDNPLVKPPVAAPAAPAIPIGGSGVTGLEGGDFPYTIYIDRMKTLIGQHWLRPQVAEATATVYFIIDRDGTIRDAKVETPSGNSTFDRAAHRAILEASPLPPLPFGYAGSFLGVHLTFR